LQIAAQNLSMTHIVAQAVGPGPGYKDGRAKLKDAERGEWDVVETTGMVRASYGDTAPAPPIVCGAFLSCGRIHLLR
jgi:hypothetical protein